MANLKFQALSGKNEEYEVSVHEIAFGYSVTYFFDDDSGLMGLYSDLDTATDIARMTAYNYFPEGQAIHFSKWN